MQALLVLFGCLAMSYEAIADNCGRPCPAGQTCRVTSGQEGNWKNPARWGCAGPPSNCFGASNFLRVDAEGKTVPITTIQTGDTVWAPSSDLTMETPDPVFYTFNGSPHNGFTTIFADLDRKITMTNEHLIYTRDWPLENADEPNLVCASKVEPGKHAVMVLDKTFNSSSLTWVPVIEVKHGVLDSPVQVHTMNDRVFVSDFAASCHTNSEFLGKIIVSPLKLIYSLFGKEAVMHPLVGAGVDAYEKYIAY